MSRPPLPALLLALALAAPAAGLPLHDQGGVVIRRAPSAAPSEAPGLRAALVAALPPGEAAVLEAADVRSDPLAVSARVAALAREAAADPQAFDPARRRALLSAADALSAALAARGLRDRGLERAADLLRADTAARDLGRRAALAAGAAETTIAHRPAPAERVSGVSFENVAAYRSGHYREDAASDTLRGSLAGRDSEHGVEWALVVQNTAADPSARTFVQTQDHATAVPEARLTVRPDDGRRLSLDLGRFAEAYGAGAFYEGFVDGARATLTRGKATLTASASSLAGRFEEAGYGAMKRENPVDATSAAFDWTIRGGRIGAESFRVAVTPEAAGARPIATLSSAAGALNGARMNAPLGETSWNGLRLDADLSRTLHLAGHLGRMDVEGFDPDGNIGRSFQGEDYGGKLTYHAVGEPTVISASLRAREFDVFSLGRRDDFYDTEYLNDRGVYPTAAFVGGTERFTNSVHAAAAIEHPFSQRWLPRPVRLRLGVERLEGWKDMDLVAPGLQDHVFSQTAGTFHFDYGSSPDAWRVLGRVRGVLYDKRDATYLGTLPLFRPLDRAELDLRLVSPVF